MLPVRLLVALVAVTGVSNDAAGQVLTFVIPVGFFVAVVFWFLLQRERPDE